MVQGYYTLDEAARLLGMDAERLNQMAQKREIRAFADRGTWRFRTQDVQELARRLGLASNPDLQLGEGEKSKPASGPKSGTGSKPSPSPQPKSGPKPADDEAVFDFSLGTTPDPLGEVQHDIVIESPSSHKLGKGGKSISPSPKAGSDSDVHLVFDAGSDFSIVNDSDVKISEGPPSSKILRKAGQAAGSPQPKPPPKKPSPQAGRSMDSGVRLVPMEEDSSLQLGQQGTPSGTDSDIRLAADHPRRAEGPGVTSTEDINLDEELKRADEMSRSRMPRPKAKPKSEPRAVQSPSDEAFQLDESGLQPDAVEDEADRTAEIKMEGDNAEVPLGELEAPADLAGSTNVAGINLHAPADSGVNLEKREDSSDSLEFELSLEPEATPRPLVEAEEADSSGEFELTLDESTGLESQPADQTASAPADSGEQDIFETDFDMPALEESPSASGAKLGETGDTELESSDFDLSIGEETGSQVVALEGEEADESAATVAYKGKPPVGKAEPGEEEVEDLVGEEELEEEYEEIGEAGRLRRAPVVVAAPKAEWGAMPALVMLPCVVVMFLLTCMGYELLNNMWGYKAAYRPTSMLVKTVAGWMGQKVAD
jgi:excisionase family DNA binding protein